MDDVVAIVDEHIDAEFDRAPAARPVLRELQEALGCHATQALLPGRGRAVLLGVAGHAAPGAVIGSHGKAIPSRGAPRPLQSPDALRAFAKGSDFALGDHRLGGLFLPFVIGRACTQGKNASQVLMMIGERWIARAIAKQSCERSPSLTTDLKPEVGATPTKRRWIAAGTTDRSRPKRTTTTAHSPARAAPCTQVDLQLAFSATGLAHGTCRALHSSSVSDRDPTLDDTAQAATSCDAFRNRMWQPDADRRAPRACSLPERHTRSLPWPQLTCNAAMRSLRVESTARHLGVERISGLQGVSQTEHNDAANRVGVLQLPTRFEFRDRGAILSADVGFDDGHGLNVASSTEDVNDEPICNTPGGVLLCTIVHRR